ncbi:sentrin-specific protease 5 [Pelobates fuscus]|uniref:sentrin-specific protease 5 n=1 Tax=Pelobates fuscus TaxID=191477 RepID=UPI002FE4F803
MWSENPAPLQASQSEAQYGKGHVLLSGCAFALRCSFVPCGDPYWRRRAVFLLRGRQRDCADVPCVPGLLPRFYFSSECGRKMKEHRKLFSNKGGNLLLLKQSWATSFGVFRKFFQKRQNVFFRNRWSVLSTDCVKKKKSKSHLLRRKDVNIQDSCCCTAKGKHSSKRKPFYKRHPYKSAFGRASYGCTCSRRINRTQWTSKLLNNVKGEPVISKEVSNNDFFSKNILTLKVKKGVCQTTEHDDGDNNLVIFNSLKKTPSRILKQRCFDGLWLSRTCNLFSRGKVPLFMMHKKLSVFTVRGRVQPQKLRARNRSFKLVDISRPWIQKVFWKGCRKSLRSKVYKAISYLKSKIQRPVQYISRAFDMNNKTSGVLCENQQCTSNTSLKEKEVSISCQGDAVAETEEGDEFMLLAPDKLKLGANENAGYQENLHMDVVENGDDSSHMNAEESTNSDVCNTKLLDHPYCKSPPPHGSSLGTALEAMAKQDDVKNGKKIISNVPDEQLASFLSGLLTDIIKKYGSLVPLSEKDILTQLKEAFNEDFSNRTSFISKEIMKYRAKHSKATVCNFRVFYNKHMLDMDDLATLDGQNWLNDQVINMYGELIMDAVPEKVHFLNSFFHRQLVTKGYNGVKRWTKKVDFFKKTMLLIPIHLEVHWSLITVNIPDKIISFYDSQGIHFKFCVENIRKYLLTEAKEKNHPEFLQGWQTAVTKCIPQQKNDSDCGVFVLQYCKCLALEQPFQFSQEDMPRVRKRIYKELCECRLMD